MKVDFLSFTFLIFQLDPYKLPPSRQWTVGNRSDHWAVASGKWAVATITNIAPIPNRTWARATAHASQPTRPCPLATAHSSLPTHPLPLIAVDGLICRFCRGP